jgi:NAD(P)-dependent dehydrogenase (short-subunit alcohol dehydrogenase family)
MQLANRVVVVTGAGNGIGAAFVRRFSAEGAKVVVTDIDGDAVDRVAGELGTAGLAVDITSEDGVNEVVALARRTYGEIDVWFSNAGYAGPPQPGELQDNGLWGLEWGLHVMAHVYAARAVLPSMVARGEGYLLQTASSVALSAQVDKAAYSVTKHACLALAEWLAIHYRPKGVRVSCFCPGPMMTAMLRANQFPEDHPVMAMAWSPEQVADLLVEAIGAEQFLIQTHPEFGSAALASKAQDYDAWIGQMDPSLRERP